MKSQFEVERRIFEFVFSCVGKPYDRESILEEVDKIILSCGWTLSEYREEKPIRCRATG